MGHLSKGTFILLLISILYLSGITALNCGDSTAEKCKSEFSIEFDEEFKKIHIETTKKMFMPYVAACRELAKELPLNRSWTKVMIETADDMSADLKKLDENVNNNAILIATVKRSFRDLSMDLLKPKTMPEYADKFAKINEKYKIENTVKQSLMEMLTDSVKKYETLYGDLREIDLKTFPIYGELHDQINTANNALDEMGKMKIYGNVVVSISDKFDAPYMKGLKGLTFGI